MSELPEPRLTHVYRLEATLGEPLDIGDVSQGRRRIVPQTGGTFTGPELNGRLLPGVSADWQTVLPDGTAIGDIRYALQTDDGALLYVQSRSVRDGPLRSSRGWHAAKRSTRVTTRSAPPRKSRLPRATWTG